MAMPLLFRIQGSKVEGLEASCQTWTGSSDEAQFARDLRDLVEECGKQISEASRLWAHTKRDLAQGSPFYLDALDNHGRVITDLLARILSLTAIVSNDAEGYTKVTGRTVEGAQALKAEAAKLKALREHIVANWPWDTEAWPPLDKAMQERAREEYAASQWEEAGTVLRRVQAGGPLVQE